MSEKNSMNVWPTNPAFMSDEELGIKDPVKPIVYIEETGIVIPADLPEIYVDVLETLQNIVNFAVDTAEERRGQAWSEELEFPEDQISTEHIRRVNLHYYGQDNQATSPNSVYLEVNFDPGRASPYLGINHRRQFSIYTYWLNRGTGAEKKRILESLVNYACASLPITAGAPECRVEYRGPDN